jgi:penicillin-binding protein 2
MIFSKQNKKTSGNEIAPDEIFLDSSNLPEFDVYQFEGRIEKPISKDIILLIGIFFTIIISIFSIRLWELQIQNGEEYLRKSQNNHLRRSLIFPQRGVIYDRNEIELVWNTPGEKNEFARRSYIKQLGLSHLLGYVSYPLKDVYGNYYQTEYIGKSGIENFFDEQLKGENGLKIMTVDTLGATQSENVISQPQNGANITLSIDSRVQSALYKYISELIDSAGFKGGVGVIMDINNGELLASTSYPEYNSNILSEGKDSQAIQEYINDEDKPFLNRLSSGLYTPGSIVKPFVALAALNENIISSDKKIFSGGSISIPNPYFPDKKTIFTDWKAHGWVDMKTALAVSSNIYFYTIGGGFEDQTGLGIKKINKYLKMFGFGQQTGLETVNEKIGVIPNPLWKKEVFEGDPWRIGDTYYTAIGQYGFQITPIQAVRAITAVANNGYLITPTILKNDSINNQKFNFNNFVESFRFQKTTFDIIPIEQKHFQIIKQGMRKAVTEGTAKGLYLPFVKVAAKTGTAELGISKKLVNSWILGFFPYEKPRYAFTVIMEKGPRDNLIGGLYVMRQLLEWMNENTPEYLTTTDL